MSKLYYAVPQHKNSTNQLVFIHFQDYFITDSQYEEWLEWLSDHGLEPPSSSRAAREDDDDSAFLHSNGDFHLRPYPAALRNENKWSHQKGTVGAVALDAQGNIAAGTSTGGLMGKMPGRVGDTPGVSVRGNTSFPPPFFFSIGK